MKGALQGMEKGPSQQMEGALQGLEKGPFTANGRCCSVQMEGTNGIACTVTILQETVFYGQRTRERSSLFPSAAC